MRGKPLGLRRFLDAREALLNAPITKSQRRDWERNAAEYSPRYYGASSDSDGGICDTTIAVHCRIPDVDMPISQMEEHIVPTLDFFAMVAMRKRKNAKAKAQGAREAYIQAKIRAREARWDF